MVLTKLHKVMEDIKDEKGVTLDVTVRFVADRAGLSTRTIQRMMAGKGTTLNNGKRVAKATGRKLEELT